MIAKDDHQVVVLHETGTLDWATSFAAIGMLDDVAARFIHSHLHGIDGLGVQPGVLSDARDKLVDRRQAVEPTWKS